MTLSLLSPAPLRAHALRACVCALSCPSFVASTSRYLSWGHFVLLRSSSPALNFTSLPLPAAIFCIVVFPQHLSSLPRPVHSGFLCSAPFLPPTLAELLIIRSSGHSISVALRMHWIAFMMTKCGNKAVVRGAASASEQACDNSGMYLRYRAILHLRKYGI